MAAIDLMLPISGILVLFVILLLLVLRHYRGRVEALEERLRSVASEKQSLATTYGRITEQFAPFMAGYPYDPRNFRFIGSPIDGVQFEEDRIVFVEIKASASRLTPAQEKWRRLVQEGRVEWLEFRADERAAPRAAAPPRGSAEDSGVWARGAPGAEGPEAGRSAWDP